LLKTLWVANNAERRPVGSVTPIAEHLIGHHSYGDIEVGVQR